MNQTTRKLTVLISEEDYRPVRVRAAELGQPISEIVRGLLAAWLKGKAVPEPENKDGDE